jgi:putative endonuclease
MIAGVFFMNIPGIFLPKVDQSLKTTFMEHWVYILYSESLKKYYIGSTNDIMGRKRRHLSNHRGFTATAKDLQLVYSEKHLTRKDALKREKQIKGWKNKKRIQQLISDGSEHPG